VQYRDKNSVNRSRFCVQIGPTPVCRSVIVIEKTAKYLTHVSQFKWYLCFAAAELNIKLLPSSATKASDFVSYLSTLAIQTVACSEVIYVRPTVNTVFVDKHCCSSVLMLRSHRLEQSSLISTHCWQFLYSLCLSSKLIMFASICSRSAVRASDTLLPDLSRVINSLLTCTYCWCRVWLADSSGRVCRSVSARISRPSWPLLSRHTLLIPHHQLPRLACWTRHVKLRRRQSICRRQTEVKSKSKVK